MYLCNFLLNYSNKPVYHPHKKTATVTSVVLLHTQEGSKQTTCPRLQHWSSAHHPLRAGSEPFQSSHGNLFISASSVHWNATKRPVHQGEWGGASGSTRQETYSHMCTIYIRLWGKTRWHHGGRVSSCRGGRSVHSTGSVFSVQASALLARGSRGRRWGRSGGVNEAKGRRWQRDGFFTDTERVWSSRTQNQPNHSSLRSSANCFPFTAR